jgi:predicted transposase YbfD/YdcC
MKLERTVTHLKKNQTTTETVYLLTSLSAERASPDALLALNRAAWSIENRSHWVRDVTFDEDRSQIRTGNAPRVMASLRNLAIGLLRLNGHRCIAAALRHFAARPNEALALLGL